MASREQGARTADEATFWLRAAGGSSVQAEAIADHETSIVVHDMVVNPQFGDVSILEALHTVRSNDNQIEVPRGGWVVIAQNEDDNNWVASVPHKAPRSRQRFHSAMIVPAEGVQGIINKRALYYAVCSQAVRKVLGE